MKKRFLALILGVVLLMTACNQASAKVDDEIKIPIYQNEDGTISYETAKAEKRDVAVNLTIAGSIGYPYGETLYSTVSANLLTYNVKKGDKLKAGDVIATLDNSAMDYEYSNQKSLALAALAEYNNNPSALNKASYDLEAAKLAYIEYQLKAYTFVAPYDCVVTEGAYFNTGETIKEGTKICSVAVEDEIYVYTQQNADVFRLGMAAEVKQSDANYKATVVSCPFSAPDDADDFFKSAAILKLNDGELERLLTDIPNVVGAGWATILVTTIERKGVLCVPDKAVNKFGGLIYCYVIENGERMQMPVELGSSYDGYTEIISGLTEGDTVIIA